MSLRSHTGFADRFRARNSAIVARFVSDCSFHISFLMISKNVFRFGERYLFFNCIISEIIMPPYKKMVSVFVIEIGSQFSIQASGSEIRKSLEERLKFETGVSESFQPGAVFDQTLIINAIMLRFSVGGLLVVPLSMIYLRQ